MECTKPETCKRHLFYLGYLLVTHEWHQWWQFAFFILSDGLPTKFGKYRRLKSMINVKIHSLKNRLAVFQCGLSKWSLIFNPSDQKKVAFIQSSESQCLLPLPNQADWKQTARSFQQQAFLTVFRRQWKRISTLYVISNHFLLTKIYSWSLKRNHISWILSKRRTNYVKLSMTSCVGTQAPKCCRTFSGNRHWNFTYLRVLNWGVTK